MVKRPDLVRMNKERRKEKIEIICKCGKSKFVVPSQINYGAKYCSQECYHKYSRHDYSKGKHWKLSEETKIKQGLCQLREKNHNWKGGITNPRKNKENKRWMRAVKKRDKFCMICGSNKELKSHHIESFDIHPEKRYDLNNGTIWCNRHHEEFHKKYGYGKNTKKQYEEFILERIEKVKKINTKNSVIYNLSLEGDNPFYANGILTHNTPPHIITPKNKKALSFEVGRIERLPGKGGKKKMVFAKKVRHPGTRPNPFIRNTINNKLRKIIIEELMKA